MPEPLRNAGAARSGPSGSWGARVGRRSGAVRFRGERAVV